MWEKSSSEVCMLKLWKTSPGSYSENSKKRVCQVVDEKQLYYLGKFRSKHTLRINIALLTVSLQLGLVSPTVELYVTQLGHQSHSKGPKRFGNRAVVRQGSNITLNCTAREPEHRYAAWYYRTYLQPYKINWFVNSSLLKVPNCDKNFRKV